MVLAMLCQPSHRLAWLRLVPEPERLLPRALAALRHADPEPADAAVEAERDRLESIVLRGAIGLA